MSDYLSKFQKSPDALDIRAQEKDMYQHPGDEGTCSQDEDSQGEVHNSAVPEFLGGVEATDLQGRLREKLQKPGQEGNADIGQLRQGNRDVPPGSVPGEFLQGPEVRKTRVMPSHGDPGAGMGKGA